MALLAPYNTEKPELADVMQLFHVYNANTEESIRKLIEGAPNPKFKLVICTAYPGEDQLMKTLRKIGFVEMEPQILRVPSYYNGTKVKLFVLSQKNWTKGK